MCVARNATHGEKGSSRASRTEKNNPPNPFQSDPARAASRADRAIIYPIIKHTLVPPRRHRVHEFHLAGVAAGPRGANIIHKHVEKISFDLDDVEEEADAAERPLDLTVLALELRGEHLLAEPPFRGLHSSTFQLNLSRFGTPPRVPLSGGKLRTRRIQQNVLTLSRKVDECKPLPPLRLVHRGLVRVLHFRLVHRHGTDGDDRHAGAYTRPLVSST